MADIRINIEVQDNGSIKIKKLREEAVRFSEETTASFLNSANAYAQFVQTVSNRYEVIKKSISGVENSASTLNNSFSNLYTAIERQAAISNTRIGDLSESISAFQDQFEDSGQTMVESISNISQNFLFLNSNIAEAKDRLRGLADPSVLMAFETLERWMEGFVDKTGQALSRYSQFIELLGEPVGLAGEFSGLLAELGLGRAGAMGQVTRALSTAQGIGRRLQSLLRELDRFFGISGESFFGRLGGIFRPTRPPLAPLPVLPPGIQAASLSLAPAPAAFEFAPAFFAQMESAVAAGTEAGISSAAASTGAAMGSIATAALIGGVVGIPLLAGLLFDRRRSPESHFREVMGYARALPGGIGGESPLETLIRASVVPGGAARTGLLPGPVSAAATRVETAVMAGDLIAAGRAWTELGAVMQQFSDNQWVQRLSVAMGQLGDQIRPVIDMIWRVRGTLAPPITPLMARGIQAPPLEMPTEITAPRGLPTLTRALAERAPQLAIPLIEQQTFIHDIGTVLPVVMDFIDDINIIMARAPGAAQSLLDFAESIANTGIASQQSIAAANMLAPQIESFFRDNFATMNRETRLIFQSFIEALHNVQEYGLGPFVLELYEVGEGLDAVTESIRRQLAALAASGEEGILAMVGLLNNLAGLNQQITERILQYWPPTLEARVSALTEVFAEFERQLADPALTLEERANRLRGFFEVVTQGADELIGQLQKMAAENQAAAREIERLSRDIYNLRREEEDRRRGIARSIFEAGLVGRFPDEANRLRRSYLEQEAQRIRTLLVSGSVTGAERIRVAEQGQGIAEEIFRLYGQDELVSLEELANVQRDVITALHFVDEQIATGYREQIEPLQEQLQTQRDLLTTNQAMLQANFGLQTAAEAIEAIQNTAAGYLETIRDRVISFGSEIANQLAPLLGADSPIYRELALQNVYVQTGNNLIDSGFQNLRRPIEAMGAELPNIPQNIANYLASPILTLSDMIAKLPVSLAAVMGGQAAAKPLEPIPVEITKINAGSLGAANIPLSDWIHINWGLQMGIPVPGAPLTGIPFFPGMPTTGLQILQQGGTVRRTGLAVVEEGETVIPAGRTGGSPVELNLELHLHQTIDAVTEEKIIRQVIPVILERSRSGHDVVHAEGIVNV